MKNKKEDALEAIRKVDFLKLDHPTFKIKRTLGQKAADNLSKWAGSWFFIFGFLIFLGIWVFANAYFIVRYKLGNIFDPYPFILLNLVLSMLAAIQAPVILMSQNRQVQKDRVQAQYDYSVNRKAEREIQEIQSELTKIKNILLRKRK